MLPDGLRGFLYPPFFDVPNHTGAPVLSRGGSRGNERTHTRRIVMTTSTLDGGYVDGARNGYLGSGNRTCPTR